MDKKTVNDLPELAIQLSKDAHWRDLLIWTMLTKHPEAFINLVNGDPMVSYVGWRADSPTTATDADFARQAEDEIVDQVLRTHNDPLGHNNEIVSRKIYRGLEKFMKEGKKVEAIKLCRAVTGLGLKEAKDMIEYSFQNTRP